MAIVNSGNIGGLIQRTLNRVDSRLVDHGIRVAYLTDRMLEVEGKRSPKERRDACFLALLHDVGAYKTEEISRLLQFETVDVWEHAIYGYLFLRHLSPIGDLAPAVLFHHCPWRELSAISTPEKPLAQILSLADRVDVMLGEKGRWGVALHDYLSRVRDIQFSGETVELYLEAERRWDLRQALAGPLELSDFMPKAELGTGEIDAYLKMLIYTIDFRSQHTVTHTITTTGISDELARRMDLSAGERLHVHYGAMLHDLGKIGIPVEILEYPGKLSAQAMDIMRTHVDITEEILGGAVDPVTANIALRHHEKLDGSGYPRGLGGAELSISERIVAVADMASALLGTRSYKEAFPKERTLGILERNVQAGLIDAGVVELFTSAFEDIVGCLQCQYAPVLDTYREMDKTYQTLYKKYAEKEREK